MTNISATKMKIICCIFFCLVLKGSMAQDFVSHKCADFVPVAASEELFNLALKKHLIIVDAVEQSADKAINSQDFYPLWKGSAYVALGQNLQHSLLMLCWFKKTKQAGLFLFEGFSYSEAKQMLETFEMKGENIHPLNDLIMYDGLMRITLAYDTFPRLNVLTERANKK